MGLDPVTHRPRSDHLNLLSNLQQLLAATNIVSNLTNTWDTNNALRLQSDATQLAKLQLLQNILHVLGDTTPTSNLDLLNPFGPSDGFLNEVLGLNQSNKLQNLYNNGSSTDGFPSQNQPNIQSFEAPHQQQTLPNGGSINRSSMKSEKLDAPYSSSTAFVNSLPNLVSASPEYCSTHVMQMENKVNPNEFSDPSSTSTNNFEMWGDFMYEEVSDAYWKDLIE